MSQLSASPTFFEGFRGFFVKLWRESRGLARATQIGLGYLFATADSRKVVTELYPDPLSSRTPDELPTRSRGFLENDILRCTGCRECERVCPTKCIRVEVESGPKPGKMWVNTFDIDYSRCLFCGLCTESCEPLSLTHTRKYERAVERLSDLTVSFGRGAVSSTTRDLWRRQRESQEGQRHD